MSETLSTPFDYFAEKTAASSWVPHRMRGRHWSRTAYGHSLRDVAELGQRAAAALHAENDGIGECAEPGGCIAPSCEDHGCWRRRRAVSDRARSAVEAR